MMTTLHDLPAAAARHIAEHGWTRRTMETADGKVCLTGALRACSPRPGDWRLAREVFRAVGRAEEWNDHDAKRARDVMSALRRHPITDDALESTFGPQWEHVVALARRAATVTKPEMLALHAAYQRNPLERRQAKTFHPAHKAPHLPAAIYAVSGAADDCLVIGSALHGRTGSDETELACRAAYSAANAASDASVVAIRDDLPAERYAILTAPWVAVMGPVHPDDAGQPEMSPGSSAGGAARTKA